MTANKGNWGLSYKLPQGYGFYGYGYWVTMPNGMPYEIQSIYRELLYWKTLPTTCNIFHQLRHNDKRIIFRYGRFGVKLCLLRPLYIVRNYIRDLRILS